MMHRGLVVALLAFPVGLSCQTASVSGVSQSTARTTFQFNVDHSIFNPDRFPQIASNNDWLISSLPFSIEMQPPRRAAHASTTPRHRTALLGSMVGYIDDAVPKSMIRVRYDAAFDDPTPDRAEYFYAKCGCYRGLPPDNPAFDPNAPGPGPGIPAKINFQQLYLMGEFSPVSRLSAFVEVPFRWLQPKPSGVNQAFDNQSGISDVRAGLKFAVVAGESQYLTFQLKAAFPSGDSKQGLGTNHYAIEPMLLYYQSLSRRAAIEAQFGDTHPLSGSAPVPTLTGSGTFSGDVMTYGLGPSFRVVDRPSFSLAPVVELVGWHVFGGYQTAVNGSSDGVNIVNIKFGARAAFSSRNSIYVGYGRGLTSDIWYQDIVRAEYRYQF